VGAAGVLFVGAAVVLGFLPMSATGVDCGSAVTPVHHWVYPGFIDEGGLFYPLQNPRDAATACGVVVARRQVITTTAGAIGVVVTAVAVSMAIGTRKQHRTEGDAVAEVDPSVG
jgi:hypothetical protein